MTLTSLDNYIPLDKMHGVVMLGYELDYLVYSEYPLVDVRYQDFILSDLERYPIVFTYSNN